jgi:long-chain acyl-CoA synthetase
MDTAPDLDEGFHTAAAQGMVIAWWAARTPQRPALSSTHGDRTFAQLNARANQLANALRRQGLHPGDGVAIMCRNRPEFAEVWAACQRTGIRLTPVNWHLTAAEAGYIVDDCEAKAFVADERLAPAARGAAEASTGLTLRLSVGGKIEGFSPYEDVIGDQAASDIESPVLGSLMLYTSGTTGRPKGVHRPPENDLRSPTVRVFGYRESDAHLCTGPLYHAAPLSISLTVPLSFGTTVVLMDHWDAAESLRLIEAHRVTHTHMVPTMFHRLLALPEAVRKRHDLSSLRFVLHGAAPCPVPIKQAMMDWLGPIVHEYYAATEGFGTIPG